MVKKGMIMRMSWPLQPHRPHARVKVLWKVKDAEPPYYSSRWRLEDLDGASSGWYDDLTLHSCPASFLVPDSPLYLLAKQAE